MNLIDEIEAAAKGTTTDPWDDVVVQFVSSPYWPRIREALLAAEEMTDDLRIDQLHSEAVDRFRKAYTGKEC